MKRLRLLGQLVLALMACVALAISCHCFDAARWDHYRSCSGCYNLMHDIGPLFGPMISIAVVIILFEGGLTLNFHHLHDAAVGVKRSVCIGAPRGWLALH